MLPGLSVTGGSTSLRDGSVDGSVGELVMVGWCGEATADNEQRDDGKNETQIYSPEQLYLLLRIYSYSLRPLAWEETRRPYKGENRCRHSERDCLDTTWTTIFVSQTLRKRARKEVSDLESIQ
jgi:hypothetical protein